MESVCLGLVSQTRYDPETGRRLPTYIIADEQEVTRQLREHGELSEGSITEEMPLDLPGCFRNGTPYNDCVFRFGRKTGKVLTAAETATYAELGAALDKWTRAIIAAGNYAADKLWDCDGHRPCSDLGFRKPSAYYLNSYSSERCPRKLPDCHEPMLTDNWCFLVSNSPTGNDCLGIPVYSGGYARQSSRGGTVMPSTQTEKQIQG